MTVEIIILLFATLFMLAATILLRHFYHFRFVSFVRNDHTTDMDPACIEGYTDKYYYLPGEKILFYLYSEFEHNSLVLRKMKSPYEFENILFREFPKHIQLRNTEAAEQGCAWEKTLEITLDKNIEPGYYQAFLIAAQRSAEYRITFIIGSHKKTDIILVAPVSTWTAYNPYGGKSLYQNNIEAKTVYYVSSQRPNNAFMLNHDINVEANAFNWFAKNYESVNIIPDYYLENSKGKWMEAKMLALVYHCEYISQRIYNNTAHFLGKGRSLISLGANQYYWVVRWNENYTQMECRKDLTLFRKSWSFGGMWKHHLRNPKKIFGAEYTGTGMLTFAPYKVCDASHWLYAGTQIRNGDLFGTHGINELGLSGGETDKAKKIAGIDIIAHGMNCDSEKTGKNFNLSDPLWNGEGGGDITLKKLSKMNAVLSTGSIQSSSGLGIDVVFTTIIKNFIHKYCTSL